MKDLNGADDLIRCFPEQDFCGRRDGLTAENPDFCPLCQAGVISQSQPSGAIHARPAGILVNEIKKYASTVMVSKGEKSVNALKLMALMGMDIKQGDTVKVTVEGADEDTAAAAIEAFFKDDL